MQLAAGAAHCECTRLAVLNCGDVPDDKVVILKGSTASTPAIRTTACALTTTPDTGVPRKSIWKSRTLSSIRSVTTPASTISGLALGPSEPAARVGSSEKVAGVRLLNCQSTPLESSLKVTTLAVDRSSG